MNNNDPKLVWLVGFGLLLVFVTIIAGAWVTATLPDATNLEMSKLRFGAATFTGLMVLIVFCALLFAMQPDGPGKVIFQTVATATTPIIGAIVGYIFATPG